MKRRKRNNVRRRPTKILPSGERVTVRKWHKVKDGIETAENELWCGMKPIELPDSVLDEYLNIAATPWLRNRWLDTNLPSLGLTREQFFAETRKRV